MFVLGDSEEVNADEQAGGRGLVIKGVCTVHTLHSLLLARVQWLCILEVGKGMNGERGKGMNGERDKGKGKREKGKEKREKRKEKREREREKENTYRKYGG